MIIHSASQIFFEDYLANTSISYASQQGFCQGMQLVIQKMKENCRTLNKRIDFQPVEKKLLIQKLCKTVKKLDERTNQLMQTVEEIFKTAHLNSNELSNLDSFINQKLSVDKTFLRLQVILKQMHPSNKPGDRG